MGFVDYDDEQKLQEVRNKPPELGFSKEFSSLYQICEQIGQGGFGVVYKVLQLQTGKVYACKEIVKILDIPDLNYQKQLQHVENIQKEIKILKVLRGILNIVHLISVYEDENKVYLVMELCTGGPIFDRYQKIGSEGTAASIARAVLRTLLQCHAKRILHRDIKANNFLFLNDRAQAPIKAIDFGLAVFYNPDDLPRTDLGLDGTPWFQAPEVLNGQYYPKSDVWSCGVLCYQMLCGYMPFDDKKNPSRPSLSVIWRSVLVEEPKFSGSSWKHVSDEAKDFVTTLLNKDQSKRPSAYEALQHPWLQDARQVRNYGNQIDSEALARIQRYSQRNPLKQRLLDLIAQELLSYYAQKLKDQSQHGGEAFKKSKLQGSKSVHNAGLYWRNQASIQQSSKRLDLHPNLEQLGQLAQTVYENSQKNQNNFKNRNNSTNADNIKQSAYLDLGSYHGGSQFKDYSDNNEQQKYDQIMQQNNQNQLSQLSTSAPNKGSKLDTSNSSREDSKHKKDDSRVRGDSNGQNDEDSFRASLKVRKSIEDPFQKKASLSRKDSKGQTISVEQVDAKKQLQGARDLTRLSVYNEQDIEPQSQSIQGEAQKAQPSPQPSPAGKLQKLSGSKEKDGNQKQGKGFFDIVKSIKNRHKLSSNQNGSNQKNGHQQQGNQQVRNASNFKDIFSKSNLNLSNHGSRHQQQLPEIPEDNHKQDSAIGATNNETNQDKRVSNSDYIHPNIRKLFEQDESSLNSKQENSSTSQNSGSMKKDSGNTQQKSGSTQQKSGSTQQDQVKQQQPVTNQWQPTMNQALGAKKHPAQSSPNLQLLSNSMDEQTKDQQQKIQAQKDYIQEHIVGMALFQQGSQLPYSQVLEIFQQLDLVKGNQQIDPAIFAQVLRDRGFQINDDELLQLYGYANGQNENKESQANTDSFSQSQNINMAMFLSSQVDWQNFKLQFYNDWINILKRTFSNIDKDSDGRISREEFTKFIQQNLPSQNVEQYIDTFLLNKAATEYGMDLDGFLQLIENSINQPDEDISLYDNRYKRKEDRQQEKLEERTVQDDVGQISERLAAQ